MSNRKPPAKPDDWDDFDIPTWDDTVPAAPPRERRSQSSSSRVTNRDPNVDPFYEDRDAPLPPSRPVKRQATYDDRPPRLSSRVPTRTTRPSRRESYNDPYSDIDDVGLAEDPFYPAGQERAPVQPRSSSSSQYDLYAEPAFDTGWDEAGVYDEPAPPRRHSRSAPRVSRPAVAIPRPAIPDSTLAIVVGIAAASLLIMIGLVWFEIGRLGGPLPWHLDANGTVDHWVSAPTLWRIPFGSFMALAIGLVVGAYLWNRDRFAARFIVISMCALQVLAWVAVIDQLW